MTRCLAKTPTGLVYPAAAAAFAFFLFTLLIEAGGCSKGTPPSPAAGSDTGVRMPGGAPPTAPSKIDLENPEVQIETTAGSITLHLEGTKAPGTVRNFLNLVNDKFYDNTLIHYVDAGKMIVAGGYAADGTLKSAGTPIRNEAHNGLKNVRGTIAMTRDPAQIDSATSQFFINLVDAPQRDYAGDAPDSYGYCVFGQVIEGLTIAEKISQASTANHGGDLAQTPDPPVLIKSMRVVR